MVRPRRLRRPADPGRPKVILRYTGRRITAEQAREIKRRMRRGGYDTACQDILNILDGDK